MSPAKKLADFADAVLHHGDALHAHAEGEAGDFFRVVGRLLFRGEGEDRGIDHAATQQLNPSRLLALAAALASAKDATDLHVGARLGEREERGEEARFDRRTEQRLHGVVERALQIAEGDVGVDAEAFDLMKDGRVRGVGGVVAVHLAGNHDAHRRRLLLHGAHLHGRSVGAQQQPVAQRLALLRRRPPACPACRARDGRAENSCTRSCSSRSRPRAPRPPSSPAPRRPKQSRSACA